MAARDPELFAKIGGEKLREVIADFYDRVFGDVMIGFLFVGKDKQRLIDKEWEFTAQFLGGDVAYTGKSMREAHAKSPIFGGHFERRLQLMRQAMAAHGVDEAVQRSWIEHQQALRAQITVDKGSECKDSGVPAQMREAGEASELGAMDEASEAARQASAQAAEAAAAAVTNAITKPAIEGMFIRLGRKPAK